MSDAADLELAFRQVYLALHRRDGPRHGMPAASAAVLHHLAMAGPLTAGEMSAHLRRAQSVVSEIVAHLVADGCLHTEPDPADRRRHLVWLTPAGRDRLEDTQRVFDLDRLQAALDRHDDPAALVAGLSQLAALAAPQRKDTP